MENYKNTEAVTPESKASEVTDLLPDTNTNSSLDDAMARLESSTDPDKPVSLDDAMARLDKSTTNESEFSDVAQDNSSLSEEDFERMGQEAANVEDIYGFDFNYEFMDGPSYFSDDLHEQQAQRQGTLNKARRGITRLGGEFILNVLETPGIVLGAVGALAGGDIESITKNAWVESTSAAKEWLTENNEVYVREYVREGGVAAKMLSTDWWATEGASAGAFMAAALVPGLGVGKVGKALALANRTAKLGKWPSKAISQLDRFAVWSGSAAPTQIKNVGSATGSFGQLMTTTAVNTMYEAGVEARGTQLAYENELQNLLEIGEIDYAKYSELLKSSKTAGNIAYTANAIILAVPNLIMSRAMLGPRGSTLKSIHKEMKIGKDALFQKGTKLLKDAPTTWVGKALDNRVIKATGNIGKQFVKNTFREGIWEEGAQMTSEKYLSERFLHDLKDGKQSSFSEVVADVAGTYYEVLGSTDGQVAALTGGIMGSGMSIYQKVQEGKQRRGELDNTINKYNKGLSLFKAIHEDLYKTDKKGDPIFVKDENGNPTKEKELDPIKVAQLADARVGSEILIADMNREMTKGNTEMASVIAARLQVQAFLPFIDNGKEGIVQLEEALTESPILDNVIEEYNRENNTELTKDEYIGQEIEKAKKYLESDNFFDRNISSPTSYKWDRKNRVDESQEERENTDLHRQNYIAYTKDNYVQQTAVVREIGIQLNKVNKELSDAKARDASQEIIDVIIEKENTLLDKEKEALVFVNNTESKDSFEAGWITYYQHIVATRKANSVDVTTYLDKVISSVKEAQTTDEVEAIVNTAIEDGLILRKVERQNIPDAVFVMAEGDNVIEAFAAAQIISAHEYEGSAEEGKAAITKMIELLESAQELFNSTVIVAEKAKADEQAFNEKLGILNVDVNNILETIEKASKEIKKHYAKKVQYKENNQSEYNSILRDLNKSRIAAIRVHSNILKELVSLRKKRITAANKFKSYSTVLNAMIANSVNTEIKALYTQLLETSNITVEDNDFLDKLTISPEDVVKAAESKKELLLEELSQTKKAVVTASDLAVYNDTIKKLKKIEGHLSAYIRKINALLGRAKKQAKSEDKDLFVATLEESLITLNDNLSEVTGYISELETQIDTIIDNGIAVAEAKNIIDSMNDIVNTGSAKGKRTSADVVTEANAMVDEFNSLGSVDNLKFKSVTAGLIEFKDKIASAEEYASYLEKIRNSSKLEKMLTYSEFMEVKNEPREPSEEEFDEGTAKSTSELLTHVLKSLYFKVPKGLVLVKNSEYHYLYESMYGHKVDVLTNILEKAITDIQKDATNVEALSILYSVIQVPGTNTKVLNKLISTEIADVVINDEVQKEATALSEERYKESHNAKNDTKPSSPKPGTSPSTVTEDTLKTINNPTIKQAVQDIIDAQLKKIGDYAHELAVVKFKNLLASSKEFFTGILEKEQVINVGNNVSWEIDNKSNFGEVEAFIRNEGGTNVLVKDTNNEYHLLPVTAITKDETISKENADNNDTHTGVADSEKFEVIGSTQNVKLSVRSDDNKGMLKKGKRSRVNEKGETVTDYNALLNYLKEARDKSKDKVTFNVPISKLISIINKEQAETEEGDTENVKELKLAKSGFNAMLEGNTPSKEQIDAMVKHLPITFRVTRGTDTKGAATGVILSERDAGEFFNNFEAGLRKKILSTFLASNKRIGKNGSLEGVKANFSFMKTGVLNLEKGTTTNKITELLNVTFKNLKLILVRKNDKAIDQNQEDVAIDERISSKVGGIYIVVKDNNGNDFNLRLKTGKLTGTQELDSIMSLLEEVIVAGVPLSTELNIDTLKLLQRDLPGLMKPLTELSKKNTTPITYRTMLQALLTSGPKYSQIHTTYNDNSLTVGENTWTSANFNENALAIKAVLGHKLLNINFPTATNSNLNIPDVSNKDYLSYIIDTKALSTNVKAKEPIFVGESTEKEGKQYETLINPYMSADDVKFDGEIQEPQSPKETKSTKKEPTGSPLTIKIERKLERMGIDSSGFKQGLVNILNKSGNLFSNGIAGVNRVIDDFNNEIGASSEQEGDTDIKDC